MLALETSEDVRFIILVLQHNTLCAAVRDPAAQLSNGHHSSILAIEYIPQFGDSRDLIVPATCFVLDSNVLLAFNAQTT